MLGIRADFSKVRSHTSSRAVSLCGRASPAKCRVRRPAQAVLCGTTIVRNRTQVYYLLDLEQYPRPPCSKSTTDAQSAALDAVRTHLQDRASILRSQRSLGERKSPRSPFP